MLDSVVVNVEVEVKRFMLPASTGAIEIVPVPVLKLASPLTVKMPLPVMDAPAVVRVRPATVALLDPIARTVVAPLTVRAPVPIA